MIPPLKPMEPIQTDRVLTSAEWIHQVKWDGVRILAHLDEGRVRLWNRRGQERTAQYPELTAELAGLSCSAVLDGEVIAVHEGRPDFFRVLKRDLLQDPRKVEAVGKQIPVQYQLFDMLEQNGISMLEQEWEKRDFLLRSLMEDHSLERVGVTDSFEDGKALWRATEERGWEGIVMKRKTSFYRLGQKHADWRKCKHFRTLTAQMVGVSLKGERVNAILLGVEDDKERGWRYIGRAASGLGEQEWMLLKTWWPRMQVPDPPVINPPTETGVVWVRPTVSVVVRYLEWTPHGTLRSPTILHFSG
ncbi:ATP-dependent DNA ligase [Desmospora profundinema]|uniref:DNA ligase (ATP) n=1 Tax=Desmospora profundinema TaxID=1571184 RepID=A0ABU1IKE1_9BACL|nr:RNA ligase family protein [Desmospora profundinema]MDR6224444.1 bifunctional non-homologous end joining protein LigD [Desmospora profundinema]